MASTADKSVFPVFELELLKMMRDAIQKQNEILTDLRDVLRDLRDELTTRKAQP